MKRCISSAVLSFSLFIVLLVSIRTNAQDRSLDTLYAYQPAFTSSDAVLTLTGEGSFLHNNDKTGITDDVLLYPGWQKGIVNFRNGKQATDIELKFNLLRNELYFNNNNKLNYFADTVTSFSIFDTSNNRITVAHFSNGYPHTGQKNDKTYYLVLTAGKAAHLLKYISKKRQDIYEYNGPMKTQYAFAEDLEIFDVKNNSIKSVKKNIASIEKAIPEYTKVIEQALKDKNAKSLTDEEIMEAIRAVNNAQP